VSPSPRQIPTTPNPATTQAVSERRAMRTCCGDRGDRAHQNSQPLPHPVSLTTLAMANSPTTRAVGEEIASDDRRHSVAIANNTRQDLASRSARSEASVVTVGGQARFAENDSQDHRPIIVRTAMSSAHRAAVENGVVAAGSTRACPTWGVWDGWVSSADEWCPRWWVRLRVPANFP